VGDTKPKASMKSILLPFDVFERHKTVAKAVKTNETILDVGGGVDALSKFIKNKVTVTNLKSGDILADGRALPMEDNSFDVVTSIDVVEHLPKKDRKKFIEELLRVARIKVIVSTPLGTKQHLEAEKKLLSLFKEKKMKSDFIEEHVKRGLPTFSELKDYTQTYSYKFFYSGDYRLNRFLTMMDIKSLPNPKLDKIFYLLKRLLNLILNLFYFPFSGSENQEDFTNRIYLFIEKK
jgi:ubiquinone/menaquinone biosynthesis C-methylase UbiE